MKQRKSCADRPPAQTPRTDTCTHSQVHTPTDHHDTHEVHKERTFTAYTNNNDVNERRGSRKDESKSPRHAHARSSMREELCCETGRVEQ